MEGQDGCNDQVEKTKDDGSKCQSHRMTIGSSTAFSSQKRSMMCGIAYAYTAHVHEYVAYAACAENSSETSDTAEDGNLNTWNAKLELLTMPRSSPAVQHSLQDGEVCRVAMSCHSRWTVGMCPWNGKQGSDCRDTQIGIPAGVEKQGSDCCTPSLAA